MPNFTGTGTTFTLPNFAGQLYSATPTDTPFLTLIGGMTGGRALTTSNTEFPTSSLYEHPTAEQPTITETDSLTAESPFSFVRTQEKNVTQPFRSTITISDIKMANSGRLSGINTAGAQNNATNELDFQTMRHMEKLARNVEYTAINGTYALATSDATPNKTRGMLAAAGTVLNAAGAELTKDMMTNIMREAWLNNADLGEMYVLVNGTQKERITAIYTGTNGFAQPPSRHEGGFNIQRFETDYGVLNVVLTRYMPTNALLGVNIKVIAPVEQPIPQKGIFYREELARNGSADRYQIFGLWGLDHGPSFMHFKIENLEV